METVKLSSFDRLINIHQSLELNQTRKINAKILQQQIFQNVELRQLNKQLSAANDLSRQILENQIREIEHKESQRFYKRLSFCMSEFIEPLVHISDPLVKKYFIDRYYPKIEANVLTASEILEEISDKVFNKGVLSKISEIKSESNNYQKQFDESPFRQIDKLIDDLKIKKERIDKFKPFKYADIKIKDKSKVNPFRLIGLIILGVLTLLMLPGFILSISSGERFVIITGAVIVILFGLPFSLILKNEIKWRKSYQQYIFSQNQKRQSEMDRQISLKANHEMEFKNLNDSLLQDASYKTYQEIITTHPEFEKVIEKLSDLESN